MDKRITQADWIARAQGVLPAGGLGNFDPNIFIREGHGSRVWDEDGNEYVDYLIGSGPMLLGHGNPEVLEAVREQLHRGVTFFTNNAPAIELAEEICRSVSCAEKIRFVSSGGEADMYAMRLARAFTGRDKIMKFEGGYHGMCAEAQMSLAPTLLANFPLAVPDSAGIPGSVAESMVIAQFNDLAMVDDLLAEHASEIAAIIVEPLQRIIPPQAGFLSGLREACDRHGILLIFDEIVTGFRFAYGGAQEVYGVVPDICTLGKVIGGGFPLAAIAGHADIMAHFDRAKVGQEGFLMQLGTLSGNPVAAVAGLKTLEILRSPGSYDKLRETGSSIMSILGKHLGQAGVNHQIVGDPTLFDVIFTDCKVQNYRDVLGADNGRSTRFNHVLRQNGVFKSAGKIYPSLAITDEDLALTERAIEIACRALRD